MGDPWTVAVIHKPNWNPEMEHSPQHAFIAFFAASKKTTPSEGLPSSVGVFGRHESFNQCEMQPDDPMPDAVGLDDYFNTAYNSLSNGLRRGTWSEPTKMAFVLLPALGVIVVALRSAYAQHISSTMF